jgi:hypothetical protein
MRRAFVHQAVLAMDREADSRAPGGAVTVGLCGHWEHPPPCPFAPHHTTTSWVGSDLHVRIVFAVDPEREEEARTRIDEALRSGRLEGPDGQETRWQVRTTGRSRLAEHEIDHGQRLAASH